MAEDSTYSSETRRLPVDGQQVFEITAEIRSWGYYTLEFMDGKASSVSCSAGIAGGGLPPPAGIQDSSQPPKPAKAISMIATKQPQP